jgi:hypothetical protein
MQAVPEGSRACSHGSSAGGGLGLPSGRVPPCHPSVALGGGIGGGGRRNLGVRSGEDTG